LIGGKRMKLMKRLVLLLALVMIVSTTACGTPPPADNSGSEAAAPAAKTEAGASEAGTEKSDSSEGTKKYTIGLSTKTITNNEFQRVVVEEAQKVVEGAGHNFELTLAGGELEVSAQVNNIEDLVNKGVDAIIVMPMDGQAVIPALQKAKAANIPVVLADVGIAEGNDDLYLTLVGSDNLKIGRKAAEEMIKAVGEGEVVMVRGASGAMGGELRAKGFKEGLEGSKVKLVNEQAGDWLNEKAMQVTENMLSSHPDTKGVFLCSDGMLAGVLSAVDNAGKMGKAIVISVDGNISAVDEIEAGNCYGTVAQYPSKIGQIAAQTLLDYLDGKVKQEDISKFTDSGYLFMCGDNMEESRKYAY
jgi:ribose transport system substrate-binding protein